MSAVTVSYAKVEAALVEMHSIAPDEVAAFRARFGALQRGGLFGAENQPGKGRKLFYGPDQFHRAVLAFELIELGIVPSVILPLINTYWDNKLRAIFLKAEQALARGTSDVVLILLGVAALNSKRTVPNINHTTLAKISESITFALDGKGLLPARALLVNLSARLSEFHTALAGYHLQPEPVVTPTKTSKGKQRLAKR